MGALVMMFGFAAKPAPGRPWSGKGPRGAAPGSWPLWLDCMSVGGKWVPKISGLCPVSAPALIWCRGPRGIVVLLRFCLHH